MNELHNKLGDTDDSAGGLGGNVLPLAGPGQTRDVRMVERAIRERWPISDDQRKGIVNKLILIALSRDSSAREAVSACKAVIAADKINVNLSVAAKDQRIVAPVHSHQHLHMNVSADVPLDEARAAVASVADRLRIAGLGLPVEP